MKLELDPNYKPAYLELKKYNKEVADSKESNEIIIAVERDIDEVYHHHLNVFKDGVNDQRNFEIVERIVKTLLWVVGGYKIVIYGSKKIYEYINSIYQENGLRAFDKKFMSTCFEKDFEVKCAESIDELPKENIKKIKINSKLKGRQLGFDAGGSDIKVSAMDNGEVVYSEEMVWLPKLNSDIFYHQNMAYKAFKTGIDKLGGDVDSIGISSAGVIINNRPMQCSLFIKVPKENFSSCKNFYIDMVKRLEKELGHPIPFQVANDGDVSAIAGILDTNEGGLLGLAMGTSEAGGYVDKDLCLTGWFNELGFVPVDFNKDSLKDEWSGDYGVGCKYFSQDAVIKLAKVAGIKLDDSLTLAEKLKFVQKLNEKGDEKANKIFETIGVYLAYSLAYYSEFYDIKHVLLLGRVASGKGGDTILKVALETLEKELPEYKNIHIFMPTELIRRVGQSLAVASLAK